MIRTNLNLQKISTYCGKVEHFSQSLSNKRVQVQFLWSEGADDEAEDEERWKEDSQNSTQERIKTIAFITAHIHPEGRQIHAKLINITYMSSRVMIQSRYSVDGWMCTGPVPVCG